MGITEATLSKDHIQYSTMLGNLAQLLEKQVRQPVCAVEARYVGCSGRRPQTALQHLVCNNDNPRHRGSPFLCTVVFFWGGLAFDQRDVRERESIEASIVLRRTRLTVSHLK